MTFLRGAAHTNDTDKVIYVDVCHLESCILTAGV